MTLEKQIAALRKDMNLLLGEVAELRVTTGRIKGELSRNRFLNYWLTETQAAFYCNTTKEILIQMVNEGSIRARAFAYSKELQYRKHDLDKLFFNI